MHPWADAGRLIAGRYRLEAPIGRGAMGVVWRARDQLLDRDVAVKEVQIAETLTDEERANAYQRTLREAKTAARLNHPGVVTVYDVAEDEGRPWIVMQLVHAQSLDQVLATSGPLSPRRAAEMGRQLLSALTVAHAAGVMHRDVKPSNVLLTRDDRAVLTDFGIATFQDDPRLTQTGMVMGSPGFTAPERIRGEDASPASDLWSLGATLFAAVEGHGPFENRGSAITTMSAIINEDAPAAPTAGPLAPVIAALLRREPADRPDAATATRMITDVLPQLPAAGGARAARLRAHRAVRAVGSPEPRWPGQDEAAGEVGPEGQAANLDPFGSIAAADTHGGEWSPAGTASTTPQPALGDAPRYDQAAYQQPTEYRTRGGDDHPPTAYDPPGAVGPGGGRVRVSACACACRRTFPRGTTLRPGRERRPSPGPGRTTGPGLRLGPGPAPGPRPQAPAGACGSPWCCSPCWGRPGAPPPFCCYGTAPARRPRAAPARRPRRSSTGTGGSSSGSTGSLPASSVQIVDAINRLPGSLPAGWATVTHQATSGETAGFTIAKPSTWSQSTTGYQTYLRDPSANANILIDLTPHTFPDDMLREAQYIKSQSLARNRFPGYSQLGLATTTIRGTHGSYWKFTWMDNGVQQEAIDLLFVLQTPAGAQSYALYMTAPASMWTQLRPIFDEMAETFAPPT